MNRFLSIALVLVLFAIPAQPSSAWGPHAQRSITGAAAHVLSQDNQYRLTRLLKYVLQGASVSEAEQAAMHPAFKIDPVASIQREMFLLQSVRGSRIDPYYVYRLGVLGKLVAQATAPLAQASPGVRQRYYADVETAIDGVSLKAEARKLVDPRAYFILVTSRAWENDQMIIVDYQGGVGFRGFAGPALSNDASRSVNAIADVWYTIMSSAAPTFELSPSNMREYTLGSLKFYLDIENIQEAQATYEEAASRNILTADLQKAIGDLYFDAGLPERAIEEYNKVLAKSPGRRDVTERMSRHFEMVGDEANARQNLEGAREAYASALKIDSLHPVAQRKLLKVEAKIFARDERLAAQRLAIEQAREFDDRAGESAVRRDYAQAIGLLREAQSRYGEVSNEFPVESRQATLGLKDVSLRIGELKRELISNAQSLSGTGFRLDAQRLANTSEDGNQRALNDMLKAEHASAIQELQRQVTAELSQTP